MPARRFVTSASICLAICAAPPELRAQPTTPASAAVRTISGAAAANDLGQSVALLGDVDGDGVADFAVGEPGFDDAVVGVDAGRVTVYSGASGAVIHQWTGIGIRDRFGASVADAGDVNDDDRSDIIIGSPEDLFPTIGRGKVYVYSGMTGLLLFPRYNGEVQNDAFGYDVSGIGDVNNDNHDDFAVGAPYYSAVRPLNGRVYVYSGANGQLLYTLDGEGPDDGDYFGAAVSGAGDANNDTFADLAVGALFNNPAANMVNAGAAYIFSGPDGDLIHRMQGTELGDELGSDVAGCGDVDLDGHDDVVIGARDHDVGIQDHRGAAYIYSGLTGQRLHSFFGEDFGDWLGHSVAPAGDVDGDGRPDVLVGAPAPVVYPTDRSGRAYIFSGRTGETLRIFTGEAPDDEFGWSVSGARSADADATPDCLIAAPRSDADSPAAPDRGRAYLFSLPTPCPTDITGDGAVGAADLASVLGAWDAAGGPADVNHDNIVNAFDLAAILGSWGPCP